MCALLMPEKISIDFECINNILLQFNRCAPDRKEIIFDFTATNWISAEVTPFLGNLVHKGQAKGYDVYFNNLNNPKILSILEKNNFLATYNLSKKKNDVYNTTIPYKVVPAKEDEVVDNYLDNLVFPLIHTHLPAEEISAIREAVYEISHNVKDHSENPDFFICGQYYPKSKLISLSLSDNGITIPQKVSNKFDFFSSRDDAEIINWSTEKGNSTKNLGSSGLGLFDIKRNIKGIGNLQIMSRTGYWIQNTDGTVILKNLQSVYTGTFINLTFLLHGHIERSTNENHGILSNNTMDFTF